MIFLLRTIIIAHQLDLMKGSRLDHIRIEELKLSPLCARFLKYFLSVNIIKADERCVPALHLCLTEL